MKNFKIPHRESARFGIGLPLFNVLNHVNLDQPVATLQDPSFGFITSTVSTPTSIVGSFLNGERVAARAADKWNSYLLGKPTQGNFTAVRFIGAAFFALAACRSSRPLVTATPLSTPVLHNRLRI